MRSAAERVIDNLLDQVAALKAVKAAHQGSVASLHPTLPSPAPLRATDGEGTFTFGTVSKRMPQIVTSMISHNDYDAATVSALEKLSHEMTTGAQLRLLQPSSNPWNNYVRPYLGETWFTAPWWFVENYLYKRILEVTPAQKDPFASQKQISLESALSALQDSVVPLSEKEQTIEPFLLRSLWGNKADLSLSGGESVADTSVGSVADVLVDNSAMVAELLRAEAGGSVIVVLDNCGLEVVCDLCLVDALLRLDGCDSVSLHCKDAPVFVSDVCTHDIEPTLSWMEQNGASALVLRLREALRDERLSVVPHAFYTSPLAYWDLPQDLVQEFSKQKLVIVKGDANYRRLCGDRHWPFDTSFDSIMSYFPSSLLALRTNKVQYVIYKRGQYIQHTTRYQQHWHPCVCIWYSLYICPVGYSLCYHSHVTISAAGAALAALVCSLFLQSGVCVGVPSEKQQEAQRIHPGEAWLTKGVFGLVQLRKKGL
jgi:uncharacterized protein with ATP-grasp and redox domains